MPSFRSSIAALLIPSLFLGCGHENTASLSDAQKRERVESMYADYKSDTFPNVAEVDAPELAAWMAAGDVVVVDVRGPEERAVSTIPGAVTRDEFERLRGQLGEKRVAAYCTIGYRSGVFAKEMSAKGVRVFNLKGSILSWAHSGGPLVDAEGKATKHVHVYGSEWNLLPEGYESEW